jgi:putative flippase GtrA
MLRRVDAPPVVELARFVIVGAIGFLVDCGIMLALMRQGDNAFQSRVVSFSAAVTVTWGLNRAWTFAAAKRADKKREYVGYFITQTIGAGINLGVFFGFLSLFPTQRNDPVLALVIGAIPALAFNFAASKYLVFRAGGA